MTRILVSDDDPQVLRLVSLCLEHAGYDVVITKDPCEVAALARESKFDAIVLDVMMSPKSGFEVLNDLRKDTSTADVPVLFLSGRSEGSDRVRGLREGADDYLVKPFEPEELTLRVERLIAWGSRRKGADASADLGGPGARFMGRYEVRGVIGEGTMGTVYRGWDPRLHRSVALKTIRFDSTVLESQRHEMLDRLKNEAITVAKFNHPNIVTVYDMGDTESSAFIAMELIDGVSLSYYLAKFGRVDGARLVPLALGVARALETAHERQIIHRDVKPGNVLLGRDGSIKVADFGLANIFSQVSEGSSELCGTPGYVPPEALRQEPYTQAGDLFGFGAMLYEAAAGFHPLAGSNLRQTLDRTLECRFDPLARHQPDLPEELLTLVGELLGPDPLKRPNAPAVVLVLERLARQGDLHWSASSLPAEL